MKTIHYHRRIVFDLSDAEHSLILALWKKQDIAGKIQAIKFIRGQHGVGLVDAKLIVEAVIDGQAGDGGGQ
jgi:ribosomal protein L7/L12